MSDVGAVSVGTKLRAGVFQTRQKIARMLAGRDALDAAAFESDTVAIQHPLGHDAAGKPRAMPFDFGDHHAYPRLVRILGVVAAGAISLCLVLGVAIVMLFPLTRVQIHYVQAEGEGRQLIDVRPFETNEQAMDAVVRNLLARYVQWRNSVVPDTRVMNARAGWVGEHTLASDRSPELLLSYTRDEAPFLESLRTRGMTRSTIVEAVTSQGRQREMVNGMDLWVSTFLVVFTTLDAAGTQPLQRGRWQATLRVAFLPQQTNRQQFEMLASGENAAEEAVRRIGLRVVGYSLELIGSLESLVPQSGAPGPARSP